jgi:hypothetical protein
MGYAMAFVEIYGYIVKEKNTTKSVFLGVAKSLITFYATPVEQSRQAELEAEIFRSPSPFPPNSISYMDTPIQVSNSIHTGACRITNLDTFVVLLSTLTGRLISGTQVSDIETFGRGAAGWHNSSKNRLWASLKPSPTRLSKTNRSTPNCSHCLPRRSSYTPTLRKEFEA